jgi:hypothetical protein
VLTSSPSWPIASRPYSANQTAGNDVRSAAHTQLSLSYTILVLEGGRVSFEV